MEKKIVLEGEYENVIQIDNHYYLLNLKDRICVLPYTLSASGLIDKLGIVEDFNFVKDEKIITLITSYVNEDDQTDLVAANRILFEIIGTNVSSANNWMYLGNLFNNISSDSLIKIYAVNVTDIQIKDNENVESKERKHFKLIDSSTVIQSDDILFLSSFFRLFNFFYVQSLNHNTNE
jgi:hypothetical protein